MPISDDVEGIGEFHYISIGHAGQLVEAVSHSWRNGHVDDTRIIIPWTHYQDKTTP